MLVKTPTGTWLPAWVPQNTMVLMVLLLLCSMVQSATGGYDGSCLNGLNILPAYANYFVLDAATEGLNTAAIFLGAIPANLVGGMITDYFGRRLTIFWFSLGTLVGVILQGAAQNVAMFVVARVVLGFCSGVDGIAAAVYLNETFASRWRTWGAGTLNNFYYIGALIAAGITLGTSKWPNSTWSWRLPSLLQGIFSIICILILPFVPESPRWLVGQERLEEARIVVAQTNSNGDMDDPVSIAVYKEIVDTLHWEKTAGRSMSPLDMFRDKASRRRLLIGASPGVLTSSTGNIIASYYLGDELNTAGITSVLAQLKANVVLNVWCFACAVAGTQFIARWGRKPSAIVCQTLLIVTLYIIGGLSKVYADQTAVNPNGATHAVVYGNVACIFLFQGFYSLVYTPILNLYPVEVMNYSMRANGFAFMQFLLNCCALVLVYVMPIGM
ncbi:putative hexose carrier protein [Kockovaella imperatae]|uniref:Putative hexose carrier protein n=1 Tax=Kockovaella imperatae TaxID=4999 RepID=A0A1Y1UDD1_9TREE|nr:putative hexose carrier protein [Kockovaella imperatae]ORX35085.1 putative hexose carrier protein [Kockovaella imperatae]